MRWTRVFQMGVEHSVGGVVLDALACHHVLPAPSSPPWGQLWQRVGSGSHSSSRRAQTPERRHRRRRRTHTRTHAHTHFSRRMHQRCPPPLSHARQPAKSAICSTKLCSLRSLAISRDGTNAPASRQDKLPQGLCYLNHASFPGKNVHMYPCITAC